MKIFCVECDKDIEPDLVLGSIVYPNRGDLSHRKFWMCRSCKNFVGCHRNKKLTPLGVIANKELKRARMKLHQLMDPIWQEDRLKRGDVYAIISRELGYRYHTAEIRSLDEARRVYKIVRQLDKEYA